MHGYLQRIESKLDEAHAFSSGSMSPLLSSQLAWEAEPATQREERLWERREWCWDSRGGREPNNTMAKKHRSLFNLLGPTQVPHLAQKVSSSIVLTCYIFLLANSLFQHNPLFLLTSSLNPSSGYPLSSLPLSFLPSYLPILLSSHLLPLIKENKIFLTYKEIQMGPDAKSYMTKGFYIIYEEMR